jgi:hypothetical protein
MNLPRHSQISEKDQAHYLTISKVINRILKKKNVIPENVDVELDFFQWASNRLYTNEKFCRERITIISFPISNQLNYKLICKEYLHLLNLMNKGLGYINSQVVKITYRKEMAIIVDFRY